MHDVFNMLFVGANRKKGKLRIASQLAPGTPVFLFEGSLARKA